jgi:hypothetical protein
VGSLQVQCGQDELGPLPTRFGVDDLEQEVDEVVDRWFGEDYRYYRVRTRDGTSWVLRLDERSGTWQVAVFEGPIESA